MADKLISRRNFLRLSAGVVGAVFGAVVAGRLNIKSSPEDIPQTNETANSLDNFINFYENDPTLQKASIVEINLIGQRQESNPGAFSSMRIMRNSGTNDFNMDYTNLEFTPPDQIKSSQERLTGSTHDITTKMRDLFSKYKILYTFTDFVGSANIDLGDMVKTESGGVVVDEVSNPLLIWFQQNYDANYKAISPQMFRNMVSLKFGRNNETTYTIALAVDSLAGTAEDDININITRKLDDGSGTPTVTLENYKISGQSITPVDYTTLPEDVKTTISNMEKGITAYSQNLFNMIKP